MAYEIDPDSEWDVVPLRRTTPQLIEEIEGYLAADRPEACYRDLLYSSNNRNELKRRVDATAVNTICWAAGISVSIYACAKFMDAFQALAHNLPH